MMIIHVAAKYYNLLKMSGLITNDSQINKGRALFTGFNNIAVPIEHKNTSQMPDGVLMYMETE